MPRKTSRKKSRKASKKTFIVFKRNVKCPKGYDKGIPQDGSKYKTLCIKKSIKNILKSRKPKRKSRVNKKKSRKPKRKSRVNKKKSRKPKRKSRKASRKKSRKPKRKSRKASRKKSRKPKRKSRKASRKKSRKPKRKSRKLKKGRTYKMKKTMGALTESVVAGSDIKPGVLGRFLEPKDVKNVVLIDKQFYDWFIGTHLKNKQLKEIIEKAKNLNLVLLPPSRLRRSVTLSSDMFPERIKNNIENTGLNLITSLKISPNSYQVTLPYPPYDEVILRMNPDGTSTIIHASFNTPL